MRRAASYDSFGPQSNTFERVGIYSYDVRRGITHGCDRLAELFGIMPEDCAKGVPIAAFLAAMHPDDRERVSGSIQRAISDGRPFFERYRTVAKAGDSLPVYATGICFRDEADEPSYFVGMVKSIAGEANDNVDRTIEYALAAYRLAGCAKRPLAQYMIALALEDMGFVLPTPGRDH